MESGPPPSRGIAPRRWAWIVVGGLFFAAFCTAAVVFLFVRRSGKPVLAGRMPHDVDVYLEVPRWERFTGELLGSRWVDGERVDLDPAADGGAAHLGTYGLLDAAQLRMIMDATDALAVMVRLGPDGAQAALAAHLSEPLSLDPTAPGTLTVGAPLEHGIRWEPKTASAPPPSTPPLSPQSALRRISPEAIAWFDDAGLLVVGAHDLIEDVDAVLAGTAPSLETNETYELARNQLPRQFGAFGFFDTRALHRLDYLGGHEVADWLFKEARPFVLSWNAVETGSRATLTVPFDGDIVPPPSFDPIPTTLDLAGRLPLGTLAYASLATGVPGDGKDFLEGLLVPMEKHEPKMAKALARDLRRDIKRAFGVRLHNLLDAVGDQGVVGILLSPGWTATSPPSFPGEIGIAVLQEIADPTDARRVLRHVKQEARLDDESFYRFEEREEGLGFVAEPLDASRDPFVEVRTIDGTVVATVGPRPVAEEVFSAFSGDEPQLSTDPAHALAVESLGSELRLVAWLDSSLLLRRTLSAYPGHGREATDLGLDPAAFTLDGPNRITTAVGLSWQVDAGSRWVLRVDGLNLLPPLLPSLWVDTRIATRGKIVADAENTLRAIGRAAAAKHAQLIPIWNEGAGGEPQLEEVHRLCGSAAAVPSEVPRGTAYTPRNAPGTDFATGDESTGWRCLSYTRAVPQVFRLSYVAGGPYKGPGRGGPDPGPEGFEVAAEADLDGDGRTSLFTITGSPGPSGTMVVDRTVFRVDPHE